LGTLLGFDPSVVWPAEADRGSSDASSALDRLPSPGEEIDEIGARVQRLAVSNVDEATLRHLDLILDEAARQYETSDGAAVYQMVRKQRRWVEELLLGSQRPVQRLELHVRAAKLTAVLGYLAFDLGHRVLGEAYLDEAFSLADAAGHGDLKAWVRGLQSFVAYYSGRYSDALADAEDGQRHAAGGPQSIRLAAAGEARALGRLGDRKGVDTAVERALSVRSHIIETDPVGRFLSFEPLSTGRIYGNAATAYLSLGDSETARYFAELALAIFVAHNARASHVLTLVDLSMSHLAGTGSEPDAAAARMREALIVGTDLRSDVVSGRASEFLVVSRRWSPNPTMAELAEAVEEWRRRAVPPAR
jgi:tetratricopeptide (TPR) repeat protein